MLNIFPISGRHFFPTRRLSQMVEFGCGPKPKVSSPAFDISFVVLKVPSERSLGIVPDIFREDMRIRIGPKRISDIRKAYKNKWLIVEVTLVDKRTGLATYGIVRGCHSSRNVAFEQAADYMDKDLYIFYNGLPREGVGYAL